MWQSLSKIKKLASSIQHKERKCTNKKVVLEKKKPKSRSKVVYVNLFCDVVQPTVHTTRGKGANPKEKNRLEWIEMFNSTARFSFFLHTYLENLFLPSNGLE